MGDVKRWSVKASAWSVIADIVGVVLLVAAAALPTFGVPTDVALASAAVIAVALVAHLTHSALQGHHDIEVLEKAALTDSLTGLANRISLQRSMDHIAAVNQQRAHVVLFVDLDCFKLVNDSLGHAAGDEVLVRASQRLRRVLRHDDVIARLGGDEFVVVTQATIEEAHVVAQRIIDALTEPYALTLGVATIGASIGIARWDTGVDVLAKADQAMYESKSAGHNHVTVAA
jgi:diguanylate cyclase (GGDEF)-like protein